MEQNKINWTEKLRADFGRETGDPEALEQLREIFMTDREVYFFLECFT